MAYVGKVTPRNWFQPDPPMPVYCGDSACKHPVEMHDIRYSSIMFGGYSVCRVMDCPCMVYRHGKVRGLLGTGDHV